MNSDEKSNISFFEVPETPRRFDNNQVLTADEYSVERADSLANKSKNNFGKLAFYSFTILTIVALFASIFFWQRSSHLGQLNVEIQLKESKAHSNWFELAENAANNQEPIPDPPILETARVIELGSQQASNFWRALFSAVFAVVFAIGAIVTGTSLIGRKVEHEMKIGLAE